VGCFIQALRRIRFSRRRRRRHWMHSTLVGDRAILVVDAFGGASGRTTNRSGGELAPRNTELAHRNQTEHVRVVVVVDPLGVRSGCSGCEGTLRAGRFLRALRVGRVRCLVSLLLLRVRFSRRRRHWRHRTLVVIHVILIVAVDAFGVVSGGRITHRIGG
jgi:hypothetical protein